MRCMNNAYHVLAAIPAWVHDDMPPPLEMLAEQLVESGLLRIHADDARNFITYSGSGFEISFSRRQMTDASLQAGTRQAIARTLPGGIGANGVEDVYQRLLAKFKHTGEITYEKEMQVARLLVQATHPAVILLALLEQCELFVSYSHSVADLMAIHFWESLGMNGGLQSVSGDGKAVYVSCGGDPFIEKEEQKTLSRRRNSAIMPTLSATGRGRRRAGIRPGCRRYAREMARIMRAVLIWGRCGNGGRLPGKRG
jgi:hypothetical protein